MTLGLFLIAAASALFIALGIVLTPFGLRHVGPLTGASVSVPTSAVLLLAVSPLTVDWGQWHGTGALIFAAGGLFYPASVTLLNFASNRRLGPNLTAAIGNVTPLFAIALAIAFLGESLRLVQAAGIATLFAGLALIAADRVRTHPGVSLWLFAIPVVGAVLRGGAQPLVKAGLASWPNAFAAATIAYSMSATVILATRMILPRYGPPLSVPGAAWFFAIGTSNGLGLLLMYVALAQGTVSLVAPVVATYPLMTYAINRLVLRQAAASAPGTIGIGLTVLGVIVLLAL